MNTGIPKIEYIERKGVGHPDSVADLISEEMMNRYREYMVTKFGFMPNGWFDKVVVSGGEANLSFGRSSITRKTKVFLFGKAMHIDGNIGYIEPLFREAVTFVMSSIFGKGIMDYIDTHVEVTSGIGTEHTRDFYSIKSARNVTQEFSIDSAKANDTVVCAGWWPFSKIERSVISIENLINSEEFKSCFPATGFDVKVLASVQSNNLAYTVCVPFIASKTPSKEFYNKQKGEVISFLNAYISNTLQLSKHTLHLNTKDTLNSFYVTAFGSAFDKGDVGVTGRGNRYPGIISVLKPSGVEAYSGKNNYNHSGKLYTHLAFRIAKNISLASQSYAEVIISTSNGAQLDSPEQISLLIDGKPVPVDSYTDEINNGIVEMKEYALSLKDSDAVEDFRSCYGLLVVD